MATEKTYMRNVSCKEIKFNNGNSILKLGIRVDEFCRQLELLKNGKGFVNLVISPRREVGQFGDTHCIYLDTWQPNAKNENNNSGFTSNPGSKYNPQDTPQSQEEFDENLPF